MEARQTDALESEHIDKYHTHLYSCPLCGKGFPEVSKKNLDQAKIEHRENEHGDHSEKLDAGLDSGSSTSGRGRKKRRKKSKVAHDPPEFTPGSDGAHLISGQSRGGRSEEPVRLQSNPTRMTQRQDDNFRNWKKTCKKVDYKGENKVKAKYYDLCKSLFGATIKPPEDPCQSYTSREGQPLSSWLICVVDYDYLLPRYRVERALEFHGFCLTGPETQLTVQRITEATSAMSLSQIPQSMSTQGGWQQPVVSRLESAVYRPVEYQDADPLLLLDDPPARPREWTIKQGTDSGYISWDPKPQPDPLEEFTTGDIADDIEDHHHNPATTDAFAAHATWVEENTGPGRMIDENITGIGVGRLLPGPHELDDDALMSYPRNVNSP
ncbi:hypothetical protein SLS62_000685 [Diatrype stigma]|uniref:Uncharacterized protein n=1 Tax=Diatrype stigma TaxID=117547 RepID=A0AAN9UZD5_9PEZI